MKPVSNLFEGQGLICHPDEQILNFDRPKFDDLTSKVIDDNNLALMMKINQMTFDIAFYFNWVWLLREY